jgi:hypothetical protein
VELLIALLISLAVACLFVLGDRAVNRADRGTLGHYLLGAPGAPTDARTLPDTFLNWFDQLLGVRKAKIGGIEIHLPSLRRSIAFAGIALVRAAAMWAAKKGFMEPENLNAGLLNARVGLPLIVLYGVGAVFTNLLPDYLSLVQSRFVLERMRRSSSLAFQFAWLAVDLIATAATVFMVLWISARLLMPLVPARYDHFVGCLGSEDLSFSEFGRIFVGGLSFSSPAGTQNYDAAGIYIFSSFVTSFWVWLFMASALLTRLLVWIPAIRKLLCRGLALDASPFRALAVSATLVAAAILMLPRLAGPLMPTPENSVDGSQSWHESIELCQHKAERAYWARHSDETRW